ncbi:hypothetical protein ACNDF8_001571, partial [Escherichia coli]|nr:hypothetical protein [Escherichia coli]
SGEYLPGSLQGKISSDGCLKKEQMVVSAIASTPQMLLRFFSRSTVNSIAVSFRLLSFVDDAIC